MDYTLDEDSAEAETRFETEWTDPSIETSKDSNKYSEERYGADYENNSKKEDEEEKKTRK
ncbi:MAG: hypothetical protein WCQ99_09490 [Pseudomonadota bacterium]